MAEKRKIWRVKDNSGALEQVLVETSAEQVTVADTANNFTSTNVEGALAEVAEMAKNGGSVTGVKGAAETEYRKGNVNITPTDIGLDKVNNTADKDKNVASAVKATQDGDGNVIKNTYATKTEVTNGLNGKLDKTGGTITGTLSVNGGVTVGGNLTVNGPTTTIDSTTLQVTDKLIEVAHGNTAKLTSPAGLVVPKYDGTNSGALVFNGDGMAQVGKVVLDAAGNIDTTKGGLQTIATRDNLVGDNLVKYDSTNKTLVDSGKNIDDLVTTNTTQTITGGKIFTGVVRTDSIMTVEDFPIEVSLYPREVFRYDNSNNTMNFGSYNTRTHIKGKENEKPLYEYTTGQQIKTKSFVFEDELKDASVRKAETAGKLTYYMRFKSRKNFDTDEGAQRGLWNGSQPFIFSALENDFLLYNPKDDGIALELRPTGVAEGYYSAVIVDTKGRVKSGGKSVEWGTSGQTAPSDDLMPGGLFFELQ